LPIVLKLLWCGGTNRKSVAERKLWIGGVTLTKKKPYPEFCVAGLLNVTSGLNWFTSDVTWWSGLRLESSVLAWDCCWLSIDNLLGSAGSRPLRTSRREVRDWRLMFKQEVCFVFFFFSFGDVSKDYRFLSAIVHQNSWECRLLLPQKFVTSVFGTVAISAICL
jgi:hypothetical protein